MGHVKFELVNEGRGTHETFDYVPFSDSKVLSELICNRMKLDCAYSEKVYPSDIFASNGGMIFNESIIAVYVDLDRLIDTAPLSHKQRAILQLLMRGYTIQDIADISQQNQSNISHIYSRALKTLVTHHNERWRSVTTNNLRMDVD